MNNFSRYLWPEALTDKTEEKGGAGLDRIFTRIKKGVGKILILDILFQIEVEDLEKMPLLILRSME